MTRAGKAKACVVCQAPRSPRSQMFCGPCGVSLSRYLDMTQLGLITWAGDRAYRAGVRDERRRTKHR